MLLFQVWGHEATHAPSRRYGTTSPHYPWSLQGPDLRPSTMCGLPKCGPNGTKGKLVEVAGHSPSCQRCRQLMAHWARKPEA